MSETTLQDQIDAANAYESLFVPAIFGQWAAMVADAVQVQRGQRVLDVAAGTGVLAREIAARLGPDGRVVAIDPGPGMVVVGRQLAPAVQWREGVAESLPFADQSFEAVVSQFGLMLFADRRRAIQEMLRVLTPGGRLAVVVWDSLASMPAYAAEVALLEQTAGQQAANALRIPFALGNREELAALFTDTSAASIEITTRHGTARFPSVRTMVEADLRGWLPVMGVVLPEDQIDHILQQAEQSLSSYVADDGKMTFRLSAHIVTARKG
ncbi:MAG: methyltransferase domain-containing protein [Caldilineales bacterium]